MKTSVVFSSVEHQLIFLVVCICCCIQEEIQQLVISLIIEAMYIVFWNFEI